MSDNIQCPECNGAGKKDGFVNGGLDISKHHYGPIRCIRCNGTGQVPAGMTQWMEQGKVLAARRRLAGFTLLTGSKALGIATSALSAIENGRAPAPEGAEGWWGWQHE